MSDAGPGREAMPAQIAPGLVTAEQVTTGDAPDDGPVGLWATRQARYQQAGYSEPLFHPAQPVVAGAPPQLQGTWRSAGHRSSNVRAMVLMACLAGTMLINAAYSAMTLASLGMLDPAAEEISLDALGLLLAAGTVSLFGAVGYYATAVALMAWLSRVVDNVPPLTGWTPRRSPREAIGWWFVPVASYVVPYQIVRDTVDFLERPQRVSQGLVSAWWACFLVSIFGTILANAITGASVTVGDFRTAILFELVPDVALLVSGVLLVAIVRRVERASVGHVTQVAMRPAQGDASMAPVAPPVDEPARERVIVTASADGPAAPPPPPGQPPA